MTARRILALLVVAAVVLPGATYLGLRVATGGGEHDAVTILEPIMSEQELRAFLNPPNPFPDVVAKVNGETIEGSALAGVVFMLSQEAPEVEHSAITSEALDALIGNKLLMQEAKRQGLWVSAKEAKQFAEGIQSDISSLPPGDPLKALFQVAKEEQNLTQSDIIGAYQAGLSIARLRQKVAEGLPSDQQRDPEAVEKAVQNLIADLRSKATIELFIQP